MGLVVGLSVLGYIIGSVSISSLISKHWANVDILSFGSRNAGASNVGQLLGFKAMVVVGCLDLGKSAVSVFLLRHFGFSSEVILIFAAALIAGHCWSCFLRFKGGRGVASLTGVILGLSWFGVLAVGLSIASLGLIFGYRALFVALTLIGLPVIGLLFDKDPLELVCLVAILFVKRLTGNALVPQSPDGIIMGYLRRLIFDRDIASNADWIHGVKR